MPPRAAPATRFESLAFQVEPPPRRSPEVTARSALHRAFPGERWVLYPLNAGAGEFEAVPVARGRRRSPPAARSGKRRPAVPVSVPDAWELSYRLRDLSEVVFAEPLFAVHDEQQQPAGRRGARDVGADDEDPGTEGNYEWSLSNLHVQQAWSLFDTRRPGSGVVVGHPDTGYTEHPEIVSSRLRVADGFDFEDEDADASDTLSEGPLRSPGHGTSTSSVIFSDAGAPSRRRGEAFVSGVAPGAALIPLRTTRSVVLWSMSGLTRALRYAIDRRVHVVSISLGGPIPSRALHDTVRDAERAGIIVLCAAGNQVRFVVYPAAFDEVIAVAASRIDDSEWPGSCRGPAVDITAPGASVWRARTTEQRDGLRYEVARGSGTSYSVAATAGLAALWLSFHGRRSLIHQYGADRIASVFKELLQQTCRTPRGWDTRNFGPGIGHARRLLEARLPDVAPARGLRAAGRAASDDRALDAILHQLAPAPRSGAVRVLADLLDVNEELLPSTLEDVGAELAMQIGLDPALRARLQLAAAESMPRTRSRAAPSGLRRQLTVGPASRRLRAHLGPRRR